jgi:transposase
MRLDLLLPVIYLHKAPVDFSKPINDLAVIVEDARQRSPFSTEPYVFTNRYYKRIKILFC